MIVRKNLFYTLMVLIVIGVAWQLWGRHSKDPKTLRLEQAKIALATGRTSQAVDYAQKVLADHPKNIEAMQIKAEAEKKSKKFDNCETTLRGLLSIWPDSIEDRQRLMTCMLLNLDHLLASTDFQQNKSQQAKFDQILQTGLKEAKWFKDHNSKDFNGEYSFLVGRFILVDTYRLERIGEKREKIDQRLDQAFEALTQAVQKKPDNSAAAYLRAKILYGRGCYEQAAEVLSSLSIREPESLQVRLLYAEVLVRQDRWEDAAGELKILQKLAPDNPKILGLSVKVGIQKKDRESVTKIVHQLEKLGGKPEYQLALTEGLLFLAEPASWPQIRTLLETLTQRKYAPAQVTKLRGQYYLQGERYTLAAEILEGLVKQNPNNAEILELYGRALWNLGLRPELPEVSSSKDIKANEREFQAAVQQHPNDPQAYRRLSQYYLENHQVNQGINAFMAFRRLNEALAVTEQVHLMYESGREQEAEDLLKEVYPKLIEKKALNTLEVADTWAKICVDQHRLEDAFAIYDRLIETNILAFEAKLRRYDLSPSPLRLSELVKDIQPDRPTLMYEVLLRLECAERFDEALAVLDRWIAVKPEQGVLLRWRGNLLEKNHQPKEAMEAYRQALKLNPEDVQSWDRLVEIYLTNQEFCSAETTYEAMIKIDDGLARRGQAGLAKLYASIGLRHMAEEKITIVEKQPIIRDPKVLLYLGEACLRLNQRQRAEQIFARLPQNSAESLAAQKLQVVGTITTRKNVKVSAAYLEAQKLIVTNRIDEAVTVLRVIYSKPGPCQWSAGNDLAYLLATYEPKKLEEAYKIARNVYDHQYRTPQLLETLGWIEHLRGNQQEALNFLNRSILLMPSQPEIHRHLAEVYQSLGNTKWANYYRQVP